MNKKLLYFAPETEVYVLQNEGCLCLSAKNNTIDDADYEEWKNGDDDLVL